METLQNILKWIAIVIGALMLILFLIYSIGTIGFSAWLTATAKHEYITDTIYCIERKEEEDSDAMISETGIICMNSTNYISTFKYKGEKIELNDENIYDHVKVNKKYLAKIKVGTYKSGTKWYEIEKIISEK